MRELKGSSLEEKDRISQFIQTFQRDNIDFLESIREEAQKEAVPIIRDETAALLRVCLEMKKPKSILELGTAVGYSGLLMLDSLKGKTKLCTVENFPERIIKAGENFAKSPYNSAIRLLEGDGGEILERLVKEREHFDFVFLDAAKAQYPLWLPKILELLNPEGVLFCDNILQENLLLESRFFVERRQRTIHKRMREFLWMLKENPELENSIIPIGDGVSISIKKKQRKENANQIDE